MLIQNAAKGKTGEYHHHHHHHHTVYGVQNAFSLYAHTGQYMSDMENITAENIGRAAEQYLLNEEMTLVWKSA
jgi:hypothetical protein